MNRESEWDKILGIRTSGRDASLSNHVNYPYEPTSYEVLERLANSGYIGKKDVVLDYGCGKGRVPFFLSYQNRCRCIGIDYDNRMIGAALENKSSGRSSEKTDFVCRNAAEYVISEEVNRFYFFNPFSIEVLRGVLVRISESYYEKPREMHLFFYYPSDEYVSYLMRQDFLMFTDEIDCRDLFETEDNREKILIFEIA